MKNIDNTKEALTSLKTNLGRILKTNIINNQISIIESQEISAYFHDNFSDQMTLGEITDKLTDMKIKFPSIVEVII